MQSKRNYTGKRYGPNNEYASKQEMNLSNAYPHLNYQPKIDIHYTLDLVYKPDWYLGIDKRTGFAVYIEGKELFTTDMCAKYEGVVDSNASMQLLIITPRIHTKDMHRLNAHPRIEVIVSHYTIPQEWLENTND